MSVTPLDYATQMNGKSFYVLRSPARGRMLILLTLDGQYKLYVSLPALICASKFKGYHNTSFVLNRVETVLII